MSSSISLRVHRNKKVEEHCCMEYHLVAFLHRIYVTKALSVQLRSKHSRKNFQFITSHSPFIASQSHFVPVNMGFVPANVMLKRYLVACQTFRKCLLHSNKLCLFIHACTYQIDPGNQLHICINFPCGGSKYNADVEG